MAWSWRRGRVAAVLAALVALVLAAHAAVPDTWHAGSLVETFLPWACLAIPVTLEVALLRRSLLALSAALLPLVAWLALFGGALSCPDGPPDLTVVQHNTSDENPDPAATATALTKPQPDLIALSELVPPATDTYAATLTAAGYPHHTVHGTVGLWSKHPITSTRTLDIRPTGVAADWSRALRATVTLSGRDVAVYVVHLPSVRLDPHSGFDVTHRDESATLLGRLLAADPVPTIVLLGDLNATVDDRGLRPLMTTLTPARTDLAFTWPAALPVARIDQIMTRSATVTTLWPLPATPSDHLPLAAHLTLHP